MTVVEQMADFVVRTDLAGLSRSALLQLKIRILDAIGRALGAFDGDPVLRVRQFVAAAELANADGATLLAVLAVAYQTQWRLSDAAPVRGRGSDHTTHLAYSVAERSGQRWSGPNDNLEVKRHARTNW